MGILSSIFKKIFPTAHAEPTAQPANQPANQPAAPQQAAPTPAAVMDQVDVEALLNDKARNNPQKLNWRTSIVDLLKLLDIDSSLAARRELAKELEYAGDMNDSATMNIWLHRQVMNKLAENGGKVPADLKD